MIYAILLFLGTFIIEVGPFVLAFIIAVRVMKHFSKYCIGFTQWDINHYESIIDDLKENPNAYTEEELNAIEQELDEDIRNIKEEKRRAGVQ